MYDFIIIGGGTSGLSSGMYSTRLGLKTLILAEMPGGLITTTHLVENWPGIKSISGPDLAMQLYEHAAASGAEIKSERARRVEIVSAKGDEDVKKSARAENNGKKTFKVTTNSGEYESKAVLFATGTVHKRLEIPGEKEFENKGVSYCALCDGAFFKNKVVCVIGGGDSAAKEALFLAEHASKVYIIVRKDVLRAEPINADRVSKNSKIEILYKSELEEIIGDENGKVSKVRFKKTEGKFSGQEISMDGVFLAIGHIAQTDLAKELGIELNEKGEIKINRKSETNIPGVFSAGDCADTEFKQAITGSAEGVTAAYYAFHYCKKDAVF